MIEAISKLDVRHLQEIAESIRARRISTPFTALALRRILPQSLSQEAANSLNDLASTGVAPDGLATVLELLAADRKRHVPIDDVIDLVTSGPDVPGQANRDTAVVVRDMFAYAKKTVWIAGYAVHKGRRVFEALAARMAMEPAMQVTLILDVRRGPGDTTENNDLMHRFKRSFRQRDWPEGSPLPNVFYFPKSMEVDAQSRAALHAKCVVVDGEQCFVSSANFTEAAQNKNIEIGFLVRSEIVAARLTRHLEALVDARVVLPAW